MWKLPKNYEKVPFQYLDKNWVDAFIDEFKSINKIHCNCLTIHRQYWLPLSSTSNSSSDATELSPESSAASRQWHLFVNMSSNSRTSGISRRKTRENSLNLSSRSPSNWGRQFSKQSSLSFRNKPAFGSSLNVSNSFSEDDSDITDLTKCYHPECSFAYNIAGNVRKPSLITECLPQETYQRLAELWNLDPYKVPRQTGNTCKLQNDAEEDKIVEEFIKSVERDLGIRSDISEDLQVNMGSARTSGELISDEIKKVRDNPYLQFLKKSGDFDMGAKNKANLGKQAGKITKLIIKNFLDWYQSLGGNDGDTLIEESTLQELFQIGYDMPAAKALVVKIREMPTVPDCLAILRNEPKHATRYGLRKFLKEDIRLENIPMKMFAFGRMLPKERPSVRFKPPKNNVKTTWMECSRVPEELDTMKTIWVGLERLRSTIAFSNWLKNHPEITPPTYLQQAGLLEINYEKWNQMYKGFEIQADVVENVSSDLKIVQMNSSFQGSKSSDYSSMKIDSYESL